MRPSDASVAVNGRIELPTKPGLGIELDEAYLGRHPWTGVKIWLGLCFADGGVTDLYGRRWWNRCWTPIGVRSELVSNMVSTAWVSGY